ncbi:MAG: MFS transporter [Lachnospiraceae bacterium]|nr:MFS transporter [Lachnospiraceae bacterium]
MNENNSIKPFGIKDKWGYLFGDFGNDFTFIFASSYLMVFYTKVWGISAGMVGILFLVARCVDAFTDIGMGRIVDSTSTAKDGRFRCWLRRMCGPVAISSFLMYQSALANVSMTVKIVYMFVTYILWGSVFYTSINIPYGSMASAISEEPKDRADLSIYRSLGASFAATFISVVTPLIIYYTDANGNQVVSGRNFTILAGVFSVLSIVCYLLCYFMTTERVKIEKKEKGKQSSLGTSLLGIFTNRSLLAVILAAILLLLAMLMTQGINTYLFADYFRNTKALSFFGLLNLPAVLILAAVSTKIAAQFGKKESSAVGCLFAGLIYLTTYLLHTKSLTIFIVMTFLGMLGMNYFNMLIWALITDVIDDKEVKTGSRDDGTVYGFYSFARKVGQALAGGISGFALSAIGYNSLAAAQTEGVKEGIYGLATLFPGIIYVLVGLVIMFIYPLSKKVVLENANILKEKRGEE